MATYVVLVNWTDQGARDAKELPNRIDAARELFGKNGCSDDQRVHDHMGGYDTVTIIEAPSDEVIAKVLLTIGSAGLEPRPSRRSVR